MKISREITKIVQTWAEKYVFLQDVITYNKQADSENVSLNLKVYLCNC